jgi:hypothetical protein
VRHKTNLALPIEHEEGLCKNGPEKTSLRKKKTTRKTFFSDIIELIGEKLGVLENVTTCDETWIFQCDPETKRQSMHCKTPASLRWEKRK